MKKIVLLICILLLSNFVFAAEAFVSSYSSQLLSGQNANGVVGDYVIKNDSITIIISDIPNKFNPGKSGGNIIDAAQNSGLDDIVLMYLYLEKTYPRQAIYDSIQVISSGTPNDSAHIRVSGVDSDNSQISIITDYILYDETNVMKIISTFTNNTSSMVSDYDLGDAFYWGYNINPFVPGKGSTSSGNSYTTWIACTNINSRYGYISQEPFFAIHGRYWSNITKTMVIFTPGESFGIERYFAVGKELSDIYLANALLHGFPVGDVTVSVTQDGQPVNEAVIYFLKEGVDGPEMESKTNASGISAIKLDIVGSWTARCSIGGQTEEVNFTVSETSPQNIKINFGEEAVIPKDTLTVIQLPLVNIPTMILPGEKIDVLLDIGEGDILNEIILSFKNHEYHLSFKEIYSEHGHRKFEAEVPDSIIYGLYDLHISCNSASLKDSSRNSVYIIPEYKKDFTIVQVTDSHLPSHYYWGDFGLETDSTEIEDFRAVIDDINIINPDFVIHTGDLINDGEIEVLGVPSISRAKRLLYELDVPLYLVPGNHDLGGWDATPGPPGTARTTWWKFFGWKYLDNVDGTPPITQDYYFKYGNSLFIGMESYDLVRGYDNWRGDIYDSTSFIDNQITWLNQIINNHSDSALKVLFYHYDFAYELDLNELGIDLSLWGHTHTNQEDYLHPFNISTGPTCDGIRNYRIINFKDNQYMGSQSVYAGPEGANLTRTYNLDSSSVRIENSFNIDLAQCMVNFPLEANEKITSLTNASIYQIDTLSNPKMVYALVNVPALTTVDASITTDTIETSIDNQIPVNPFLMNIYPNPFNPKLAVSYRLSAYSDININIMDVNGKLVDTLYSGSKDAGNYELIWNASTNPSGIYFIQAIIKNTSGMFQSVEKCLLMK